MHCTPPAPLGPKNWAASYNQGSEYWPSFLVRGILDPSGHHTLPQLSPPSSHSRTHFTKPSIPSRALNSCFWAPNSWQKKAALCSLGTSCLQWWFSAAQLWQSYLLSPCNWSQSSSSVSTSLCTLWHVWAPSRVATLSDVWVSSQAIEGCFSTESQTLRIH
jgi:hypothetical protein